MSQGQHTLPPENRIGSITNAPLSVEPKSGIPHITIAGVGARIVASRRISYEQRPASISFAAGMVPTEMHLDNGDLIIRVRLSKPLDRASRTSMSWAKRYLKEHPSDAKACSPFELAIEYEESEACGEHLDTEAWMAPRRERVEIQDTANAAENAAKDAEVRQAAADFRRQIDKARETAESSYQKLIGRDPASFSEVYDFWTGDAIFNGLKLRDCREPWEIDPKGYAEKMNAEIQAEDARR